MRISLCVICKNEEQNIERCINSVKEVVDEIIVVDTGSTDRTLELVKKAGAKVYEIQWENDFAKARNYALQKATGDWIIFLDADEYIGEGTAQYIRPTLEQCKEKGSSAVLVNLINLADIGVLNTIVTTRIFARKKHLVYEGAIHERIVSTSSEHPMRFMKADNLINVFHTGYMSEVVQSRDKFNRNKTILLAELEKENRSLWSYGISDIHYYLMETYQGLKDIEAEIEHGKKALECNDFRLMGTRQKTYSKLLDKMIKTQKSQKEINELYDAAIDYDPTYPDFDWHYSSYFIEKDEKELGVGYLEKCIEKIEGYKGLAQSDYSIKIIEIYHLIIDYYIELKDFKSALIKLVKLLKVDKYDYSALKKLLTLLDGKEQPDSLIQFLSNIYDYTDTKDKLTLVQRSRELSDKSLYVYFTKLLTMEEKQLLG